MSDNFAFLEDQIRDCFGRVAWSHKTHEKQADSYETKNTWVVWGKIIITALAATGGILSLFSKECFEFFSAESATTGGFPPPFAINYCEIISAVLSSILLLINLIFENRNYAVLCNKHRDTATRLWSIREDYLSLLTDIRTQNTDIETLQKRRDEIQKILSDIYSCAPRTSDKAYKKATDALHGDELSFSDEEIDKMLPPILRKGGVE